MYFTFISFSAAYFFLHYSHSHKLSFDRYSGETKFSKHSESVVIEGFWLLWPLLVALSKIVGNSTGG